MVVLWRHHLAKSRLVIDHNHHLDPALCLLVDHCGVDDLRRPIRPAVRAPLRFDVVRKITSSFTGHAVVLPIHEGCVAVGPFALILDYCIVCMSAPQVCNLEAKMDTVLRQDVFQHHVQVEVAFVALDELSGVTIA